MTPGVRRLLYQSIKWIGVPLALLGVGYFIIGPYVMPRFIGLFMKEKVLETGDQPRRPAAQPSAEGSPSKKHT
ncbi:MAG: hypothetical protein U0R49_02075 [Fimbriimonadales bacterium]